MNLTDIGEFGLIKTFSGAFEVPENFVGIGDDCAVIPQRDGMETLVSTDMLVEGTHFLAEDIAPEDLGWKSAAVNFSDIAAMGGRPLASFLSLALPKDTGLAWVEAFISGYRDLSMRLGAPLLGGDTVSSPDRICINVTVLGECARGASKKRSGAKAGDLVCVTGNLGDSAAGLKLILEGNDRDDLSRTLIERHYRPVPRVKEGCLLAQFAGVHAMMDISDGVASDLRHILDASAVGAEIDTEALPFSKELLEICSRRGWDARELALSGGEDYELLFTIASESEPPLNVKHRIIGRITSDAALKWKGSETAYSGYHQF